MYHHLVNYYRFRFLLINTNQDKKKNSPKFQNSHLDLWHSGTGYIFNNTFHLKGKECRVPEKGGK